MEGESQENTDNKPKIEPNSQPNRSDEFGREKLGDFWYRIMEMIPGGLVWITLFLSLVLSFVRPLVVIYFIIIFDVFWLYRIIHFCILVTVAWRRFRRDINVDWFTRVQALPRFVEMKHIVFLPTVSEPVDVLRNTLEHIASCKYSNVKESFIIVLGGEERAGREEFLERATQMEREFGRRFFRFVVTVHPKGLPHEIVGKGSNMNWMGHKVKELVDSLAIPHENVIVSAFDCDTAIHPQYFSYLTFKYLTHPNPTRTSYQPMALYSNNIWEATAPVRLGAFGTTFWLMGELVRPERLSTFSSHSMSFKALVDVDFWQKDIVTEDSRIFLQCLLKYNGDYTVTPMYVPVSMDTVTGTTFWESMVNLYKQQRRWAWGIEHFPYLVSRFHRNRKFPGRLKFFYLWNLMEGMFTWATAPLLIFALGRLPLLVAPQVTRGAVFFQNAPHTLEILMTLAMIGVFFTAFLSLTLLPKPPEGAKRSAFLFFLLQWALVPITFTVFGSFPAVDAQTRLMLGKYLGFNVTTKKRSS